MSRKRQWQGVPVELTQEWRRIFGSSENGIDVEGLCPVCNSPTLHRWFDTPRAFAVGHEKDGCRGYGGEWDWCSSCHSYEHYSGLVPDWWQDVLTVDPSLLTHDPDAIEAARLQ